jgi:predicted nucleic acid-binding Zn ribbon protein
VSSKRRPEDDRRVAWGTDRDPGVYARRRARAARRRAQEDRRDFDPAPPADDDWVVPDRSQLVRVPRGPESLGELLDRVVRDRSWGQRLRGAGVFDRWDEVVGADLAQHCRPVRLAGGVLTVAASSPQWATQLRYLTGQLALNVNAAMGEPVVTSVHVVVGRGDADR